MCGICKALDNHLHDKTLDKNISNEALDKTSIMNYKALENGWMCGILDHYSQSSHSLTTATKMFANSDNRG